MTGATKQAARHTKCSKAMIAALLATTAMITGVVLTATSFNAQAQQQTGFNIPSGPLNRALAAFGSQSGTQLSYEPAVVRGKSSPGISGAATKEQALARILQGSGLTYNFTGTKSVLITERLAANTGGAAPDGSLILNQITVSSGGAIAAATAPYETAAPTTYISGETIERYRGSSPADMFRGTPGVKSGEARNGAGSIDVNIRGMQGMGRVSTTIDGAENSVTVYQGYQGVSNRTFVDPDFIAGVEINKGADTASWGNAGSVSMRTVGVDDIVKDGNHWGIRVKGGIGGNTSKPLAGALSGYQWPYAPWDAMKAPVGSKDGLDRPSFLSPTSASGSIVGAYKGDSIDVLAGYARRKQGNYHAGTRGSAAADPVNLGKQPYCNSMVAINCTPRSPSNYWNEYYANQGLTNYRPGEEILNTQLETESWLAKLNARFADDHELQLGYMGYRSEAGDRLASRLSGIKDQSIQQKQTAGTSLDTVTARYNWKPEDNELIDLRANLYWTHLQLRNPVRGGRGVTPGGIGLPADFRVGSDSDMWGGDIQNKSAFTFDAGDLDLTYGTSFRVEDTRGSEHSAALEGWMTPRDAIRHEVAAYTKAAYKPVDWLTVNGGLRYSHFWSKDRFDPYERNQIKNAKQQGSRTNDGGFSPSVGLTFEPWEQTQFYVNYSNTLRAPSIIESVSAFNSVTANTDVKPERSSNWEIGTNVVRNSLLADEDTGMLKLGYFNWDVKNYISRNIVYDTKNPSNFALNIGNIHRAKFSGLEFSGRYELDGFTADLAANYYLNVEYCRTSDSCDGKSLYGDYATNHVQPKYSVDLTLSQKLLEERLMLGGRVSYTGPRAIGHGDVTAQGASEFITPVLWKPYALVDLFAEYKITDNLTAAFRVENVFDKFYIDPLGLVTQPGPGRTFYASLTADIGGEQQLPSLPSFLTRRPTAEGAPIDWTGLYAGAHAGGVFGRTWGNTTALDGTSNAVAATESADFGMDSGLFGVQAGYNWQLPNRVVLGIGADWSKTYLNAAHKARTTEGDFAGTGNVQAQTLYDIDWTAAVRGKLGYAFDNKWMLYGSGGVAFARESQSREQYRVSADSSDKVTEIALTEKEKATRFGWTAGGGIEYAINDRWSVMADYSYTRFGKTNFNFNNARAGIMRDWETQEKVGVEIVDPSKQPGMGDFCTQFPRFCKPYEKTIYETVKHEGSSSVKNGRKASNSLDFHTFKIGVNYRF